MLGIVFVFAAVLIVYYKQISEGYEDQSRFEIMQKVGMTKREIRKSINSQMLTVFFLPLVTAGVHLLRDLRSVLCPCIPADIRGLLLDRERCERAVIYSVTEKNKSNDGAPNP